MSSTPLKNKHKFIEFLARNFGYLCSFFRSSFQSLDRICGGNLSFFFRHWGKSKFMMAMSKKVQVHGVEKVFLKSKKAFFYFFMFYLIRDTILYIIIPIYFAKSTGN